MLNNKSVNMKKLICFLLFYFISFSKAHSDSLVVEINSGLIEGEYVNSPVRNTSYYSFRGIPYAQPPLGELRFRPPVPPKPWDHVLETKADGSTCLQIFFGGSEDCLYLNVYTPNLPNNGESELLPVMVSIHGGGFIYGSSHSHNEGPDYLIDKNIVLVALNYRLNIFGFLNGMEESAPGNVGMKDQVAALQWVRQNIEKFGGDPEQVTIFGESAGSMSVQYHMQSNLSRGLFHRAIMQSGSTLNNFALETDPVDVVHKIARILNINSTNVTEIINELRNVPAIQLFLISLSEEIQADDIKIRRERFVPSIEYDTINGFITEDSYSLLVENKIDAVPFIAGYVSNEGLMAIYSNLTEYEENPRLLVSYSLNIRNDTETEEVVADAILRQYFNNDSLPFNISYTYFNSDESFVRGIRKSIEFFRNNTTIFHYIFDYKSHDDGLPGVTHAAEQQYILYKLGSIQNEEERRVTDQITTLWTNFAKTGNPTPNSEELLDNVIWPQVPNSQEGLQYLYIGKQLEIRDDSWQEYCQFWEHIFNTYGNPPFHVY